jgi:hypothetical protein
MGYVRLTHVEVRELLLRTRDSTKRQGLKKYVHAIMYGGPLDPDVRILIPESLYTPPEPQHNDQR